MLHFVAYKIGAWFVSIDAVKVSRHANRTAYVRAYSKYRRSRRNYAAFSARRATNNSKNEQNKTI
jgi:hypothetical protein